jgi:large subunit ribosomal protein L7/L12
MATPQKEAEVQRIEALLKRSTGIYFTDFTGLNVQMMTDLRRRLREMEIVYRVVKNSLVSRALANLGLTGGETSLIGPTGIACTERDPISAIKILTTFGRENGRLRIKSGFVDAIVVTEEKDDQLARLPSTEALFAQALAVLQSPVVSFLACLMAPIQEFMGTLEAAITKRQEEMTEESMEGTTVESTDLSELIETIDKLRVFELHTLSKMLQERWGVTAAAPSVVTSSGPQTPQVVEPVEEEKTEFDVVLTAAGEKKIQVIKVVRAITDLGLKEAKALVDEAPKPVREGISREEADRIKAQLEEVGATVEIR